MLVNTVKRLIFRPRRCKTMDTGARVLYQNDGEEIRGTALTILLGYEQKYGIGWTYASIKPG